MILEAAATFQEPEVQIKTSKPIQTVLSERLGLIPGVFWLRLWMGRDCIFVVLPATPCGSLRHLLWGEGEEEAVGGTISFFPWEELKRAKMLAK